MSTFIEMKKKKKNDLFPMQIDASGIAKDVKERTAQKNITSAPTNPIQSAVGGAVANKSGKNYNPTTNYTQAGIDYAKNGDIPGAMFSERMHNTKDGDLGLGWGASGIFNYIDPQGYGGQLERKYGEIEDHFNKNFQYDYRDDDGYKAMRKLKEKEADKAYADGYAQLSAAFDGDIPVNMMNKLWATKSDIIDQADSYIPQLRQMAYDMYMNKGNQLYNQYGLLQNRAADDYNRWSADRDLYVEGIIQNLANKQWREQFDYNKERDTINDNWLREQFDYGKERDAVADSRYEDETTYAREQDEYAKRLDIQNRNDEIAGQAFSLYKQGLFRSPQEALNSLMKYYGNSVFNYGAGVTPHPPQAVPLPLEGEGFNSRSDAKVPSSPRKTQEYTTADGYVYFDEDGNLRVAI